MDRQQQAGANQQAAGVAPRETPTSALPGRSTGVPIRTAGRTGRTVRSERSFPPAPNGVIVGYLLDSGSPRSAESCGAGALARAEAPASASGSGTRRPARSRGTAPPTAGSANG